MADVVASNVPSLAEDSIVVMDEDVVSVGGDYGIGIANTNDEVQKTSDEANFKPHVGQEFNSEEDAFAFYKLYARKYGFGVRKSSFKKERGSGRVKWRMFVCDRQGFKKKKEGVNQRTKDTRTGCKARLTILRRDDKWVVSFFVEEHFHDLMEQDDELGFRPSEIPRMLNSTLGEGVMVQPQHIIDELRSKKKNCMGSEVGIIVKQFYDFQSKDPNFYFTVQIDNDGELRSLFWADSRARYSYMNFSDVIIVDTTYRTKNYQIAPFIGINHHQQSTFFGCALLADESEETFVWLFEKWLACMFEVAPSVIVTDMDPAMRNAILRTFPKTKHRYCSWHISKHAYKHLAPLRDPKSGFEKYYNKLVYGKSIVECEEAWEILREKYEIEDGSWFHKMWEERHHWVEAYFKDVFTAGTTATSRSTSMNAFFGGYVNPNMSLTEFVKQYNNALCDRRRSEEEEDFKTSNSQPKYETDLAIEIHAGGWYTRKVFVLFQQELKSGLGCWSEMVQESDGVTVYLVGKSSEVLEKHKKWCNVTYQTQDGQPFLTCSCAKFESEGLICKHILYIMHLKWITFIPAYYLLRRWSIHARHENFSGVGEKECTDVNPYMIWLLKSSFISFLDDFNIDVRLYEEIRKSIEGFKGTAGKKGY